MAVSTFIVSNPMPLDIASIERATLAAVPPDATEELPGWLLGLDHGTVGRAHSAVPLQHTQADPAVLPAIEARYAAHGLRAVFRIPAAAAFDGMRAALTQSGYAQQQPTVAQVGTVAAMAAFSDGLGVDIAPAPGAAWASVFLGDGFDPTDGAHRVRLLGRAQQAVFANISIDGQAVACGTSSFSHGWASVHGMRTVPAQRGQGLASRILGALAREAQARGIDKVFLQVEAANTGAQALYQRAGFATAWGYAYWRKAAA
jgi:GNAT superfamily N-acetyltransferase